MSKETASNASPAVTEMLRDLCQWAILGTIQADAEESIDSLGVGYGFLRAARNDWDTAIREHIRKPWRDHTFGFDQRNLMLASPRDLVTYSARAILMPRKSRVRGDPILNSWHSRYTDSDVVYVDVPSLITNLRVSQAKAHFLKVEAVYTLDEKPSRFDIAHLESMDELTTEEGLRRLLRLGNALLDTVTVRE